MTDEMLSLLARYSMTAAILEKGTLTEEDADSIAAWLGEYKTYDQYRTRLWAAALRLFHGGRDAGFLATFARSIDVELTKAWNEGADEIGIAPDEMTDRDMKVLGKIIANENKYTAGMADDIVQAKDDGMDPDQFERQFGNRVNVWANRWNDVRNQALLYFGKKQRLIWGLGHAENHCATCPQLNGIVAFGDEWSRVGFHPQRPPNNKLACGGWECGCDLSPTTQRRTTNALKKLRVIAGMA